MDWTIFHALNGATRGHGTAQAIVKDFDAWAIFVLAAAVAALWLIARPGGSTRPKMATASAVVSAVLALGVNAALGEAWYHDRPFVTHRPPRTVLLVHHGADNGFPSEHASVAFAIAFAVLAFYPAFGFLLLVGAVLIGLDRIFVGVHYPSDVGASFLVGLGSALVVTTVGRTTVAWAVRHLSRVTDPVVGLATRRIAAARRSPPG
jgi:undecaprenyl-diphosphatase